MQAGKHQSPAYPAIASTAPKNHSIEVTKALASAWSYRQQNEQIPKYHMNDNSVLKAPSLQWVHSKWFNSKTLEAVVRSPPKSVWGTEHVPEIKSIRECSPWLECDHTPGIQLSKFSRSLWPWWGKTPEGVIPMAFVIYTDCGGWEQYTRPS